MQTLLFKDNISKIEVTIDNKSYNKIFNFYSGTYICEKNYTRKEREKWYKKSTYTTYQDCVLFKELRLFGEDENPSYVCSILDWNNDKSNKYFIKDYKFYKKPNITYYLNNKDKETQYFNSEEELNQVLSELDQSKIIKIN